MINAVMKDGDIISWSPSSTIEGSGLQKVMIHEDDIDKISLGYDMTVGEDLVVSFNKGDTAIQFEEEISDRKKQSLQIHIVELTQKKETMVSMSMDTADIDSQISELQSRYDSM